MRTTVALSVALTLSASISVLCAGPNWAQWRGPDSAGVSDEAALPTAWSPASHVAWKTEIPGRSHSSPIVWGNRLFLTTALEGAVIPDHQPLKHFDGAQEWRSPDAVAGDRLHTLQVISLDAQTGRILWTRTAYEGPVYDDRHRKGSYAAQTPVTDGNRVYAYFGSEGLYAFNLDGSPAWKAALGKIASMSVGLSTSPVLYDGLVIIQADEDSGTSSFIAAVDAATGKERWRVPRSGMSISWGTPVIAKSGGRAQLIAAANERIVSYDPRTGQELWRETGLDSNAVPSPVIAGDLVIIAAGSPTKKALALRLNPAPGESRRAWEYNKGVGYVPSPIAYAGYVYLSTDTGILTCLDAKTGALQYEGGRPPVPATFSSSPVAFGGHLYMTSEDGETYVIAAGPKHEIVRTNTIGEPVFASFALANGTIYVRGTQHLFALR